MLDGIRAAPHFVAPSAQGFLDDLDDFVWYHDEPVGSLSMYAGYCVARTAARGERVRDSEWRGWRRDPLWILAVVFHVPARARAARSLAHAGGPPDWSAAARRESYVARTSPGDATAVLGPPQRARYRCWTANSRKRSAPARAGKPGASPKSERDSDDVPCRDCSSGTTGTRWPSQSKVATPSSTTN